MNRFAYIVFDVIETLLRMSPIPCRTGLVKIGNPGRNSPVLLTCNFHLTVQRVKRALKGRDAYLLVANSRGINVWCAAAGGHFTNHDVISALKTSGIEELVDHRQVMLPQLAAAGIETTDIRKKAGWKVIWGPVYAKDIPPFIDGGLKKDANMRNVKFTTLQRLEAAVSWAFPISLLATIIVGFFGREVILPLVVLIWGTALLMFLAFPLYSRRLKPGGKGLNFQQGGIQVILLAVVLSGVIVCGLLTGGLTWMFLLRWGLISLAVVLILSIDLSGSTPVLKSGFAEDKTLTVVLDEGRCRGVSLCEQVCPRNCYEMDNARHKAATPRIDRCVRCGACIIQCPFDALYFKNPEGGVVTPEEVRRFKTNMTGKRSVQT